MMGERGPFTEDAMNDERRFGIADGLVLIAGVGAGLGLVRYIDPEYHLGAPWGTCSSLPTMDGRRGMLSR